MLTLKKANTEDIEKEWQFVKDMPADENGLLNSWEGVSFEDFREKALPEMLNDEAGIGLPDWKVPCTTYFLWDDEVIVGQFRLRHHLNDALRNGAGHVGYFVKKEFRGKGYATEGLRLLLEEARKIVPEDDIYLRVDRTNPASLRVMKKNGGRIITSDENKYYVRIKKADNKSFRLIFVRHGEPDYVADRLTKKGHAQAEAVAERLKDEGIEEIYASPMGRARETAAPTAEKLGLPIKILDYMHEVSWGGEGVPDGGHPWTVSEKMVNEDDFDFYHEDWRKHPAFEKNEVTKLYDMISEKIDGFLEAQGFRHEGSRFFCERDEAKTVALFSHGGSGACALAHILSLPYPYVCTFFPYEFTSVIVLEFPVRKGRYVHPRVELFNDVSHTKSLNGGEHQQNIQ